MQAAEPASVEDTSFGRPETGTRVAAGVATPGARVPPGPDRGVTVLGVSMSTAPSLLPFADLAARVLAARPSLGTVRLVCVDGPSGGGKTVLAGRLAQAVGARMGASPLTMFPMREGPLGVQVVHLDDLYEGWDGLAGVGDRLEEWILGPLRSGRAGRYRRYDWHRGEYAEWREVPVRPVLIIEGVGAAARWTDGLAVLTIWVEAPAAVRYERAIARDEGFRERWDSWAAAERGHFAEHATRERADLVADSAPGTAHDPRTELVLLRGRSSPPAS